MSLSRAGGRPIKWKKQCGEMKDAVKKKRVEEFRADGRGGGGWGWGSRVGGGWVGG